ncbi:MAG TPA: ABC transporter ATP-binding protein [Clostridiales bacterium]|nr:ABC transporter ATP-binding protein [Clostridiales bacterium]
MNSIQVNNVTKYYNSNCVLNNVSLKFESNKIYGLLGRNGVGKTTLLNMITNRVFPTTGQILIGDEDVSLSQSALEKVYYMTEKTLYLDGMTINKVFSWTNEFYKDFDYDYAMKLSHQFGLDTTKKIKSLSTGFKTIAKLITTLASNAEIMIFDEPILGLDANHRDMFYKRLLESYIENPKTIILSTHIIEEIADLLEMVVIINDETILMNDSVENLLNNAYRISGLSADVDRFIEDKQVINVETMAAYKSATIKGAIIEQEQTRIKELNLEIAKVELQKLFIYLTQDGGKLI